MTPEKEIARIERMERILAGLKERSASLKAKGDAAGKAAASIEALVRVARHYRMDPSETIKMLRSKTTRTPDEDLALQAWEYIQEH